MSDENSRDDAFERDKPIDQTKKEPTGDYEVGYCRPPVATRFTPGSKGNPGPRSRVRRSPPGDFNSLFGKALLRRKKVNYHGKNVEMSAVEIIVEQLVADLAKNPRNLKNYLPLITQALATLKAEEGGSDRGFAELQAKIDAMAERGRAFLELQQAEHQKQAETEISVGPKKRS